MFVAAESFTGSVSTGIFTHFKNAAPGGLAVLTTFRQPSATCGSCGQRAARFTMTTDDEARHTAGPGPVPGPGTAG